MFLQIASDVSHLRYEELKQGREPRLYRDDMSFVQSNYIRSHLRAMRKTFNSLTHLHTFESYGSFLDVPKSSAFLIPLLQLLARSFFSHSGFLDEHRRSVILVQEAVQELWSQTLDNSRVFQDCVQVFKGSDSVVL